MTAVPAVTPVTTPVAEPTVATDGVVLLHEPPLVASLNVEVEPGQTVIVPEIADGNGFMLIVALPVILLVQPVVPSVATTV